MKKFLLLFLSFAYLASSAGATIYVHQCMGKTTGWELNIESSQSCFACGVHKDTPKDCCRDQVTVLKSNLDQRLPVNSFDKIFLSGVFLSKVAHSDFQTAFQNVKHDSFERFIFPRSKIDYCILHCTFLI
jgi:hypothetical protein